MNNARELLRLVTEAYPPGGPRHHGYTLPDDRPGLALNIWADERSFSFILDENDLTREPADLFKEIEILLAQARATALAEAANPTTARTVASGPLDALQIMTQDRDVWKAKAAAAEQVNQNRIAREKASPSVIMAREDAEALRAFHAGETHDPKALDHAIGVLNSMKPAPKALP